MDDANRVSWRSRAGVVLGVALLALAATPGAGATAGPQGDDAPRQVTTKPAPVLYVMNAGGGTLTAGSGDELALALTGVNPTSTWFTDRPARRAGTTEVGVALKAIGFGDTDQGPPNAVLEIPGAPADENAVALTLTEPVYDAEAATLQFTAAPLERLGSSRGLQPYRRIVDESVPETFDTAALFVDDADAPVITDNPDNPDAQGQPNSSPTCYFKFYNVTPPPSELDGHTVELLILRAERTGAPKWVSNVDLAKLDSGTYKVQPSKGLVYIETPPYTDFFPSCGATFSGVFVVDGERRDALTWSWTVADPGYGDSTASCTGSRGTAPDLPQLGETLVCDARVNASGQPANAEIRIGVGR
jgi:hypothetical protein